MAAKTSSRVTKKKQAVATSKRIKKVASPREAAYTAKRDVASTVGLIDWKNRCVEQSTQLRAEVRGIMTLCGGVNLWAGVPEYTSRIITPVMLQQAQNLVMTKHGCQLDKGGNPYVQHPLFVASLFRDRPSYQLVALMHDLLEDTDVTAQTLYMTFPPEVVDSVIALTCKSGESYDAYLQRICDSSRTPRHVLYVKLADMYHNLDYTRLRKFTETEYRRFLKYRKALAQIKSALGG